MTTIESFINRLGKIGVEVILFANYPYIYLDSVNGNRIQETFWGEHGFTAFFKAIRKGEPDQITDISKIFKTIRKYL